MISTGWLPIDDLPLQCLWKGSLLLPQNPLQNLGASIDTVCRANVTITLLPLRLMDVTIPLVPLTIMEVIITSISLIFMASIAVTIWQSI